MREFIIRRTLYTLFTLLCGGNNSVFYLSACCLATPLPQVISPALDESAQARLKEAFGLDKPLYVQYVLYFKKHKSP